MAKFLIEWELVQSGYSKIEAKDLQDAIDRANESVDDFGDPEQFTQEYDVDNRWEVKSIEETDGFSHRKVIDLLTELSEIDPDFLDREEQEALDKRVAQAKAYLEAGR